ncbi:MAG: ATP-binding protein [Flavobacteriales bacterium]|nr:ATP-binding protein [Flavobacteriales bacterium]
MIHLILGNTGAGKTTYSIQLRDKESAVIFSIDKWNETLFFADKKNEDGLTWFLERIDRAEKVILDLIVQLESVNTNSILDLGFSKFEHREKFRAFAAANGYETKTHFLDISKEIRKDRVLNRNKEKGSTYQFEVSMEDFEFMEYWFERPSEEEIGSGVIITN